MVAPPAAADVDTLNTATLVLDGQVRLVQFRDVVQSFTGLLLALGVELAKAHVDWELDELLGGQAREQDAVISARGEADEAGDVERVVDAYLTVGKALAAGQDIPYSRKVRQSAHGITRVLNGRIPAVHFQTSADDATVVSHGGDRAQVQPLRSYGAITGRVQALSSRQGLRFTLYDSVFDRAVSCFLRQGQEDLMREAWGKQAIVAGWVSRDPVSGRPIAVREVSHVEVRPVNARGDYRRAMGILTVAPNAEPAEDIIRRLRDAS